MIPVTKTFLPPIEEYQTFIQRAYTKQWLTNRGELILELEEKLKKYLGVTNIIVTNNGTIPLQIALKLLARNGEVITTPFSYIATTSSIIWQECKPVFADIHPEYLTIDEKKIENAITPRTTAILATHVFGNPCNVEAIDTIAKKYGLKVIYDAAHCFGVEYNQQSIFEYGDISTCSFHATKLFHTAEGGAMFCKDKDLQHQLFYSHNFGHDGPLEFFGLGINGKISELQAAMGLAVFPYIDKIIERRKNLVDCYNAFLTSSKIQKLKIRESTKWNYSYYPVIFETEEVLLKILDKLALHKVFPRRYFCPSLNRVNYVNCNISMPVSESIAKRILCLPLYFELQNSDVELISKIITNTL